MADQADKIGEDGVEGEWTSCSPCKMKFTSKNVCFIGTIMYSYQRIPLYMYPNEVIDMKDTWLCCSLIINH